MNHLDHMNFLKAELTRSLDMVETMKEKHEFFFKSYIRKEKEIEVLKAKIKELEAKLDTEQETKIIAHRRAENETPAFLPLGQNRILGAR